MLTKLKHLLLKSIDLTALGFLEPIVRLCYGEEPRTQLKKIGQFVVVPIIVFAMFIVVWSVVAPRHKTKSGEVPTPAVTLDSYHSIMTFHSREKDKERAYLATGESRETWLAQAQARLAELKPMRAEAEAAIQQAEADQKESLVATYEPALARYNKARKRAADASKQRVAKLKAQAETIQADDTAAKKQFLIAYQEHTEQTDEAKAGYQQLKQESDAILKAKFPRLVAAQSNLTRIAEEEQYLAQMTKMLQEGNREAKIDDGQVKLDGLRAQYAEAEGATLFTLAKKIDSAESRLAKTSDSTYAKPWTLPMQIIRSIYCVFVGFLMGSAIAIPIGVLCGLSRTFMAAMTPFIALFKPVSPIVWLPIFLIVIGGFFPDPDKHWLFATLWEAPVIGWLKINPAFLASAATVAMCSLWATMVNTALGVASVDKDHINVARVLRLGFWPRLFKIVLPSALPLVFAGLRISLGVGWMVLIAAELLASSEGLGKFVWDQFNNGASDSFAKMVVVVFVVGIIGLLLDRIMIVLQRAVSFEGSVATV